MGLFMQEDGNGNKLTVFSDRSKERSCVLLGREAFDLDPQYVETLCRVLYDNAGMQWPGAHPKFGVETTVETKDGSEAVFRWATSGGLVIKLANKCVAVRFEFTAQQAAVIKQFIGQAEMVP